MSNKTSESGRTSDIVTSQSRRPLPNNALLVKYKYYLSKFEDQAGRVITWRVSKDSGHCYEDKRVNNMPDSNLLNRKVSSCSVDSGVSSVNFETETNVKDEAIPRALQMAIKNAPEEQRVSLSRALSVAVSDVHQQLFDENLFDGSSDKFGGKVFHSSNTLQEKRCALKPVPLVSNDGEAFGESGRRNVIVKYKYLLKSDDRNATKEEKFLENGATQQKHRADTKRNHKKKLNDFAKERSDMTKLDKTNTTDKSKEISKLSLSSGYSSGWDGSTSTHAHEIDDLISEEVFDLDHADDIGELTSTPRKFKAIDKSTTRDDQLSRTSKNQTEKITFIANLGTLPYRTAFRLTDHIRHLKTFIQLISGIPPNKQRFVTAVKKGRKLETLNQLGFKGGDVIYLDVI